MGCGAGVADGCYYELDCVGPFVDVRDVVGLEESVFGYGGERGGVKYLVHQTEDHLVRAGVFGCQLRPEVDELVVGWTTLADDLTIPTRVYPGYQPQDPHLIAKLRIKKDKVNVQLWI